MPQLMPLMWSMFFIFMSLIILMSCLIFWGKYMLIEQDMYYIKNMNVNWKW